MANTMQNRKVQNRSVAAFDTLSFPELEFWSAFKIARSAKSSNTISPSNNTGFILN